MDDRVFFMKRASLGGLFVSLLAGLVAGFTGCAVSSTAWKGTVQWPEDERAIRTLVPLTEAGAALAASAAVRKMIRTNDEPRVFMGCLSPEQGLDVAVCTGPTKGLYYVVHEQRFLYAAQSRFEPFFTGAAAFWAAAGRSTLSSSRSVLPPVDTFTIPTPGANQTKLSMDRP